MRKLRLDLDELNVESFETDAKPAENGTVFGEQQPCTCYTACTCPGCPTCGSCENTCGGASCGSCYPCESRDYYTCGATQGYYTCDPSNSPFECCFI